MRPYMCTPHTLHACRWMVLDGSTMPSLSPFCVTFTLSFDTTATIENSTPFGLQHWVQPQTWLCATCAPIDTLTGLSVHLQDRVPPAKSFDPCLTPLSTDGWIETAMIIPPPLFFIRSGPAPDADDNRPGNIVAGSVAAGYAGAILSTPSHERS